MACTPKSISTLDRAQHPAVVRRGMLKRNTGNRARVAMREVRGETETRFPAKAWFLLIGCLLGLGCVLGLGQAARGLAWPALQESAPAVLLAAGDIADCDSTRDSDTADLLDTLPGTVATLGDNVYERGSLAEFAECFEPDWGRHNHRIRPAAGNHDYETDGAEGYYTYFGEAASPLDHPCEAECKGYYSYNLGAWHIVALNSEIAVGGRFRAGGMAAQRPGRQSRGVYAGLLAHPAL